MKHLTASLKASGQVVQIVGPIVTDDDRRELRADTHFTDGTVALFTYPTRVVAFFGQEPPRMQLIPEGVYLAKGPAGDFALLADLEGVTVIVERERVTL